MYVPPANAWTDDTEVRDFVAAVGSAELVTARAGDFPRATLLPIVWSGDTVTAHLARASDHWRLFEPGEPVLLLVRGPQAYVSPSWYASKDEHGRVVPTWNYSAVHLVGHARVVEDADWLRTHVEALTRLHEERRAEPWAVDDAPPAFVAGQLRGIVGVEVTIEDVVAKEKLSQNRSGADRAGVVAGLRDEGGAESSPETRVVADRMARDLPD